MLHKREKKIVSYYISYLNLNCLIYENYLKSSRNGIEKRFILF